MRVQFGNINFQRAIKINMNMDKPQGAEKEPAKEDIERAANNVIAASYDTLSRSSIYDSETSREISAFLRAQISDFNTTSGSLFLRKINNDYYLFTGGEALKLKSLEGRYERKILDYKKDEREKLSSDMTEEEKAAYIEQCEAFENVMITLKERELLDMVEDGRDGKRKTALTFNFDEEGRLKKAVYYSSRSMDNKAAANKSTLVL